MSKPLGYYTNWQPGHKGILDDIQGTYGSCLQGISHREKLYLIQELARDLSLRASGGIRSEMHHLQYDLIKQLEPADKEGMIHALIDGLRN
ncbi:MAG: hypothetical protein WBF90_35935 [Rivularia sp. (in: cyanobacteria)]